MTDSDKEDLLTDYVSQLEENACIVVALSKEKQTNATAVVYVDSDGNDATVTVYDFKYHTWKSSDTFDNLAATLLGSPDYGTVIAYFNGVANESELEAGTKVKIPVLSEDASNTNNKIYAEPEKQENYGIDIKIDDDGDFDISGGDIKTVDGRDNLTQAIALRLTTASNKRIRLSAYGIRTTIGDPVAVESYLSGSIEQTIQADPRISEVNELTFEGDGDKLKLEVVYTDINGDTGMYKGIFKIMAKIRRYDEIMAGATANMIAKQDKITDFNEGSIIHTILDTVARIAERAYVAIRQGYNEMLAILPYSPFKFTKKEGYYASGTVVFSRANALGSQSIIPKGTVVSGGGFTFTTTEAGIIPADSLNSEPVTVIADGAGSDYNIAAGVISAIDSIVPADVVSVTNSSAFTGGTDKETDAEFEERFRTYINGLSGTNSYAIKSAALSVNAVRSISIQNHKPPLKNIYNMSVYVDDGSGGASEETLDAVKLAIEGDNTEENPGHLAPGVNIRVITPTAVPVNIEMNVSVISTDTEEARTEIQNVVTAYVNSLTIGEACILSSIITKVMALNYVRDVAITSPAANVEPAINQIARIGTISITLTEVD